MTRMSSVRWFRWFLLTSLVVAGFSWAPAASAARTPVGSLTLTSTESGCVYTASVAWVARGAKTLEVFLTENSADPVNSPHIATTFVPITGKYATTIVVLPALNPSASLNNFYTWAQLRDANGDVISGSLDFASIDPSYCTAP